MLLRKSLALPEAHIGQMKTKSMPHGTTGSKPRRPSRERIHAMREMLQILPLVEERQELGLHYLQTQGEGQAVSEKHTMPYYLAKLEQEVQELKVLNEYLRDKIGKRNERIQHLIRLGLETTRPDGLERWQEEEEL